METMQIIGSVKYVSVSGRNELPAQLIVVITNCEDEKKIVVNSPTTAPQVFVTMASMAIAAHRADRLLRVRYETNELDINIAASMHTDVG